MKCFTADISQLLTQMSKFSFLSSPSNPSILEIYFEMRNFERSKAVSCSATPEASGAFTFW